MQIFKIRQGSFKEIRKKAIIMTLPLMLIAVATGIIISSINSKDKTDINVLAIVIPLTLGAVGFGMYRSLDRQKSMLESYTLTITSNLITREQLNTPTISIYFNEVMQITKNKKGGITIKGKETSDLIWVPIQIDNKSELEEVLKKIQPITIQDKISIIHRYPTLVALVSLGLMLCAFTLKNKIIVALTGSALIVIMAWSFIKIRSSKDVDTNIKKSSSWLILLLIVVFLRIILTLAGLVNN